MRKKVRLASYSFHRLAKNTLGRYLKKRYRVSINDEEVKELKPPYLILPNHVNNWDPFMVSVFMDNPIHWVASDEQFRNPIKASLLRNLAGAIPKTKNKSDMDTVRTILKIKKMNGVVGIFPEGARSWQGKTRPLVYSTAKLAKSLKIPVVTVLIKGGYMSKPRWALKTRIGKMQIDYKIALMPEEIKRLSVEEIHENLTESLEYDEYQDKCLDMIPFKGKRLAEYIEKYLFVCPKCDAVASLESMDDIAYCRECDYSVRYNEYGYFEKLKDQIYFKHPGKWDQWQLLRVREMLKAVEGKKNKGNLVEDDKVKLFTGQRMKALVKKDVGNIILNNDGIFFEGYSSEIIKFDAEKIVGINVVLNREFEFYYEDVLYRFKFNSPRVSPYKWVEFIKAMKEH
ncbi:lysophospholipid acyltransferase family protein [Clostridium sp. DL1XJH146]